MVTPPQDDVLVHDIWRDGVSQCRESGPPLISCVVENDKSSSSNTSTLPCANGSSRPITAARSGTGPQASGTGSGTGSSDPPDDGNGPRKLPQSGHYLDFSGQDQEKVQVQEESRHQVESDSPRELSASGISPDVSHQYSSTQSSLAFGFNEQLSTNTTEITQQYSNGDESDFPPAFPHESDSPRELSASGISPDVSHQYSSNQSSLEFEEISLLDEDPLQITPDLQGASFFIVFPDDSPDSEPVDYQALQKSELEVARLLQVLKARQNPASRHERQAKGASLLSVCPRDSPDSEPVDYQEFEEISLLDEDPLQITPDLQHIARAPPDTNFEGEENDGDGDSDSDKEAGYDGDDERSEEIPMDDHAVDDECGDKRGNDGPKVESEIDEGIVG